MSIRRYARPRALKGGWRKLFYFTDELDQDGYPYGPMLSDAAAGPVLVSSVAVPAELFELVRRWHLVPMRHDATISGVVADWIADNRELILAHPFNRAKRNRDTAAKLIDRIEKNMRAAFADPERNGCDGPPELSVKPSR